MKTFNKRLPGLIVLIHVSVDINNEFLNHVIQNQLM